MTKILSLIGIAGISLLLGCGSSEDPIATKTAALSDNNNRPLPVPTPPFNFNACGHLLNISFPESKEHLRQTTLDDGTIIQHIQGTLKARLTVAATGASLDINVSGPGTNTIYPNGDFLFEGRGRSVILLNPVQAANNGVPQIFANSGHTDVLFTAAGVTVQRLTGTLTDVCALLP